MSDLNEAAEYIRNLDIVREYLLSRYEILTPDTDIQNKILRRAADVGDWQAEAYLKWIGECKEST